MTKSALLLIDIQDDYLSPDLPFPFPADQVDQLLTNSTQVIDHAQTSEMEIIYIQHIFDGFLGRLTSRLFLKGHGVCSRKGIKITERLPLRSDHIFVKNKRNAFTNPALDSFLNDRGIQHLYLAGLDGIYCVNSTAKGALDQGYQITLIEDAIITVSKKKWQKCCANLCQRGAKTVQAKELI
ncbi:cysteine hydrolase family protein [Terasakiella pusilla]|uniref:cysteine hydrolase family protein n=1 Tax=Terasakiella pusilla TaxID=64973 RepID=UPI003AA81856